MDHASGWGVALVFIGCIGASAIIFQLDSSGGQKNVSSASSAFTTSIGDAFKQA